MVIGESNHRVASPRDSHLKSFDSLHFPRKNNAGSTRLMRTCYTYRRFSIGAFLNPSFTAKMIHRVQDLL